MSSVSVKDLFGGAVNVGDLSTQAMQLVTVPDVGNQIQAGLGISVDDVTASDGVTLVGTLIDDSGSIRSAGNSQVVRDGHNLVIDSLGASKQKDSILAQCMYLNGHQHYPFVMLDQTVPMTVQNYNPNKGTPLYDQSIVFLGLQLAKAQEFLDNGVAVRTVGAIITDGADVHSAKTASDVRKIVEDMVRSERHIVLFMGIDDQYTDFYEVASGWTKAEVEQMKQADTLSSAKAKGGMGIPPAWVLNPGNTQSEIRKAFALVSQSAVRASQGGKAFSQVATGGFGG